jgi:hypothetical protein
MLSNKNQSAFESNTAFMVKIEDLVREIAIQNNIPYYRIESRMEHYAQMSVDDSYMPIIRIITYFEDTVNQISEILRTELDMVQGKSIDKKKNRIDSFSYKHLQYFANLKSNRTGLIEYRRLGDKKFELQLCSMLQDAWSGIEKELGYDTASYPDESKRDFYRVGALLEMADIEFLKIRKEAAKAPVAEQQVDHHTVVAETVNTAVTEETYAASANTFTVHLQAVAQDVPAPVAEEIKTVEAAVAQSVTVAVPEVETVTEVIVVATPVVEHHYNITADNTTTTGNIAEHPAAVAQQKQEVVVIVEEAKHEVIVEVLNIVEEPKVEEQVIAAVPTHTAATHVAFNHPLVPQRVMPAAPKPVVHSGLAPKRIKVPVEETATKFDASIFNVNSNGALAINARVAEPIDLGPLVEQPAPAQQEEPEAIITNTVTEVHQPVQAPELEIIALVEDKIPAFIPVPEERIVIPQMEIPTVQHNNNVNSQYTETEHYQNNNAPKMASFFEEPVRTNRVVLDENAPMNEGSLREYVISSLLLKEIDMRIAERAGAKINPEIDIEGDVERLRFLKVFTLKQLQDRLTDNKNDIVSFAEKWIGKDNGGSFDSGISLFYLEYLLVGKKNDPAFAIEYVVKFISDNDYSARYIIPTYNSIRSAEVSNNFSHLTLKA